MNEDILLSEATKLAVHRFLAMPSHAVIVLGQNGAGKKYLAKYIAAKLLNVNSDKLESRAGFRQFSPINSSIGIDEARQIQNFLKLKTTGTEPIRRICIINEAHTMTNEAQNAILKTLEEPPEDTVIILTATPSLNLKATIFSRAQRLLIRSVGETSAVNYFTAQGYDQEFTAKCYRISGGLIGLMNALVKEDQEHSLVLKIEQAKTIIKQTKFERLAHVDELTKDKESLPQLLFALRRVSQSALDQAVAKDSASIERLNQTLKSIHNAEQMAPRNANTKLLLTDLLLSL